MTGVSAVESYKNGDVSFLKNFDEPFSGAVLSPPQTSRHSPGRLMVFLELAKSAR
jgi:hypothetical protein